MKEPENFGFCLIFVDFFFLTLSNKRNKVSGDHDRRTQVGLGSMNKKNSMWVGGVSLMEVFFMWAVFSLHVRGGYAIFSVCVWGGVLFLHGGGALLGLPPHNNFCGSLLSQIFIIFPDRGGLNFFWGSYSTHPKNFPPPPPPRPN